MSNEGGGLDPKTFGPIFTLSPLSWLSLHTDKCLAGGKKAVQDGNKLYVSPAMLDLIEHAESSDELHRILNVIQLVDITQAPKRFSIENAEKAADNFAKRWAGIMKKKDGGK